MAMTRMFFGFALVAVLAVSFQARAVHAHTKALIEPATWTVAGSPDLQSADLHTLVGFHALHAGF
jgi:hypothetical protein